MKRILVTGGTGFVGSNLIRRMIADGHEVHATTRPNSSRGRLMDVENKIFFHVVDLLDKKRLEAFILELKPNIIFHLAAYGSHFNRETDDNEIIRFNIESAVNLMSASRKIHLDCFINTGSSSEYGPKDLPMKEADSIEPANTYAVSKAAATMFCSFMAKKFGLPIVTLRLFSPFGYYDDKERLIPAVVHASLGKSKLLLERANPVRDYIFIDDVIEAYVSAVREINNIKGEVINIGSGAEHSLEDVLKEVKKITNSSPKVEYKNRGICKDEGAVWVADISKARSLLRFEPKVIWSEGLRKTVEFARLNTY